MKSILAIAASAAILSFAGQAQASSSKDCGMVDQSQWMSKEQMIAKAEGMGYKVRRLKVEDGCYEIYGIDASGNRVETYFHPASGAVVRTKIDD
ncbi:MAG: PepSY domain-containing protein [Rhizobiaceae bacterium]